jgi:zinc protease
MWRKEPSDRTAREIDGPADATQAIVEALNADNVDMIWTSGHATEKDWHLGYSFRSGAIVSEGGNLAGVSLGGERFPVQSKNPKIYYAPGNCLIGNIADSKNSMCLSWLRAGAVQFIGYTVPTWYGYMGWGIADYFFQLQDAFTFSEAFFLNNQALVWDLEVGNLPADMRVSPGRNKEGHLHDRDVVVLYGDPVVKARLPRHATPRFTQRGSVTLVEGKEGEYEGIFSIKIERKDSLPRPAAFLFPHRLKNFRHVKHDGSRVLFTDSFLLLAVDGELEVGEKRTVTFLADRMTQEDVVLAPLALEEGRLAPWERNEIHNQVILLLGRREDSAALSKAVELLARLLKSDSRDVTALYNMACAYALLKDKPKALEYLEKAVDAGWDDAAHTKVDSDLEILREEPEFQRLIEMMEK